MICMIFLGIPHDNMSRMLYSKHIIRNLPERFVISIILIALTPFLVILFPILLKKPLLLLCVEFIYFLFGIIYLNYSFNWIMSHKKSDLIYLIRKSKLFNLASKYYSEGIQPFSLTLKHIEIIIEKKEDYLDFQLEPNILKKLSILSNILITLSRSSSFKLNKLYLETFEKNKKRTYYLFHPDPLVAQLICDILKGIGIDVIILPWLKSKSKEPHIQIASDKLKNIGDYSNRFYLNDVAKCEGYAMDFEEKIFKRYGRGLEEKIYERYGRGIYFYTAHSVFKTIIIEILIQIINIKDPKVDILKLEKVVNDIVDHKKILKNEAELKAVLKESR